MKNGLIVYLAGGADLPENSDLTSLCRQMGVEADRVELVGSSQGFFDVQDAWHHLLTHGCGNIRLIVAHADQHCLRPVHPPVRLTG
jgi:hypothetical protein